MQLDVDAERRSQIPDREFFHDFVRAMFFHRRKFLRSSLVAAYKAEMSKADVDEIMHAMSFGPDARAEQLSIEQIKEMCGLVSEKLATI